MSSLRYCSINCGHVVRCQATGQIVFMRGVSERDKGTEHDGRRSHVGRGRAARWSGGCQGMMVIRSGSNARIETARARHGWRRVAAYGLALAWPGISAAAHAGALGAASRAVIRIEVSVAPRLSFGSLVLAREEPGRPAQIVLRCTHLNTHTARFSLILQGPAETDAHAVSAMATSGLPPVADACPHGRDRRWLVIVGGGAASVHAPPVLLLAPL